MIIEHFSIVGAARMRFAKLTVAVVAGFLGGAAVVQAQDWSGYHAGLSFGKGNGDMDYNADGSVDGDFEGSVLGAFLGYNMQSGNLVYGGELAYSTSNVSDVLFPEEAFKSFVDLKGKLGFASGRALYYGVLGYSFDNYNRDGAATDSTGGGLAFGIGADFAVNDQFFIGIEALRRDLSNDGVAAYVPLDAVIDTVSVRLGMSF